MALSPRILKGSAFTPRSISGLALWLDAADAGSTYTTDAGPVTAVASPLDIAGCVGWWDASDAGSITASGGLVSQWNDKSTAGNHATASSTARPTTGTRSLNGKNVLDFDGTANAMATSLADTATQTVLFVAVSDVASSSGRLWSYGTTNRGVFSDSGTWAFWRQQTSGAILFGATASATSPSVACALFTSNSSLTTFGNGAQGTTNDPVDSSGASFNIGKETTNFFNGYIAEIVIYNTALSTAERARVESYLATKWGISGVHVPAAASSDPVGAWLDKSGNGRHAVQATAGSRPTISATAQNGRKALAFDGSNGWMRTERTTYAARSVFTVFRRTGTAPLYSSPLGKQSNVAAGYGGSSYQVAYGNEGGWSVTDSSTQKLWYTSNGSPHKLSAVYMRGVAMPLAAAQSYQTGIAAAPNTTDAELLYAEAATDTDGNQAWFLGTEPFATTRKYPANILEVLIYNLALTTTERQRLERYLAAKWGIALAPTVSNADAQDWINRVYSNGGTVSTATAAAVNTFCNDIDAAGIRDRFFRMNIFAGSNLNAALVPLFRGPSLGGTQYGNTTDTNVGPFVSGDYNETEASGGLANANRGKYLNTGFPTNTVSAGDRHLAFYAKTFVNADYDIFMGSESAASLSQQFALGHQISASDVRFSFGGSTSAIPSAGSVSTGAFWIGVHGTSTGGVIYKNGASDGTGTLTAATPTTSEMHIYGINRASIAANVDRYGGTSGGYSIGLSMTAAQAAAYYNAMQAFQTALTRNV